MSTHCKELIFYSLQTACDEFFYISLCMCLCVQVVLTTVYILAGDISDLISSFNASIWTYYCLSFVSLLIMRVTHRHEPRPFKVWIIIPALMVLVSLAIVVVPLNEQWAQSLGAFGVISLSVPVYFVFVRERSRLRLFSRASRKLSKRESVIFATKRHKTYIIAH